MPPFRRVDAHPLLLVVGLMFLARLWRLPVPQVVITRLSLANGFLAGGLMLSLMLVFLQGPDNVRGFGVLTSIVSAAGYFMLVLAFTAFAQSQPGPEPLLPPERPRPHEGITIRDPM